jgi:hypothetical protein
VCMAPSTLSDLLHRIISRVRSEHHVSLRSQLKGETRSF